MNPENITGTLTEAMRAEVILEALKSLWVEVAGFIPDLIGALIILVVGYLMAKIVQKVATGGLKRLRMDRASERIGLQDTLQRAEIRATASEIVGKIVFWVIILTFLIPAAETLGLSKVSETIDALIAYLPNVIGAALIVVVGLVVTHFIQNLVRSGAESIGFEYAEVVAKLTYGVMVVIIATLAIGQLKIETALLSRVVEIVIIAVGVAVALAMGLGARELAHNMVAGFYAREQYKPGNSLRVGQDEGTLEIVGAVSSRIKTGDGHTVYVPNSHLVESVVRTS